MERELIFRGKRIDNDKWVMGSLYITNHNTYIIEKHDETLTALSPISVNKDTVGQYIGLKDVFGNLLFEDDVVLLDDTIINDEFCVGQDISKSNFLIKWSDDLAIGFSLKRNGREKGLNYSRNDLVKIGNIHDKPELLNSL